MEIRIAAIGNVDSAKSTTISCLSNDILDDGRGYARSKILKHKHESNTGRTSSITQYYIKKDSKVIGFIDLAGHEKYLKTTTTGLTGSYLDYVLLTIGGDRGIIGMTKEHLSLAISLKIPLFIIITKIDISPQHKLERIIKRITKIMSSKAAGSRNCQIIKDGDKINNINKFYSNNMCPIFLTSNTKGTNLDNLKNFVYDLPPRYSWSYQENDLVFTLDEIFKVKGIGIVLSGIVKQGKVCVDNTYLLGPFHGKYKEITVKSIHNNFREIVPCLETGHSGCIAIRLISKKDTLTREQIKRGMVLLNKKAIYKGFTAEVLILHHPTTVKTNYQPVIHCGSVRQTAKITKMSKEYLRAGDKAHITFEFLYHQEWIECGSNIVFREGLTKGVGTILSVY